MKNDITLLAVLRNTYNGTQRSNKIGNNIPKLVFILKAASIAVTVSDRKSKL